MPTKVLVFESDPSFAGELRTELARLGLVAQVVDDGYAGLMAAASDKPDLILLSIELPRMNGFSVCNKLKKDPALKDVPLIIMSSESSDDTFEQHRKLRTRAEDYVHKPIAFGELLEHMRPFVQLDNGELPASSDDAGIIIDDFELSPESESESESEANGAAETEHDAGPSEPDLLDAQRKVDDEVEAFANTAFDRLLDTEPLRLNESEAPGEDRSTERKLMRASIIPRSSVPPRPTVDAEVERLQNEVERQKTEMARLERELSSARADVQRLQDDDHREAASNEHVQRLQRELDDIRAKAASGQKVGGVSGREFLDLREAVNKKEKEILSLRDQITRKEKELLDASDTGLALERNKADLEDKLAELDKEVLTARAAADTAKADKEQAAKRAEDFKTRGEKTKAELEIKLGELAVIQKRHEDEMAAALAQANEASILAREDALASERRAAEEARAAAVATREAELVGEADQRALAAATREAELRDEIETRTIAAAAREAELRAEAAQNAAGYAAREAELRRQGEDLLAEVAAAHGADQSRLKAEIAKAMEDLEGSRVRLAAREGELENLQQAALDAQRGELEARHAERIREVEGRVAELSGELSIRTEEREVLAREVQQVRERVVRLESDLAARQTDLTETREKLSDHGRKLEVVGAKWLENKASLEQAKDALAAALAQIDEVDARGV